MPFFGTISKKRSEGLLSDSALGGSADTSYLLSHLDSITTRSQRQQVRSADNLHDVGQFYPYRSSSDNEDDSELCSNGSNSTLSDPGRSSTEDNTENEQEHTGLSRSAGAINELPIKRLTTRPNDALVKMSCKELVTFLKKAGFSPETLSCIKKNKIKGDAFMTMDSTALSLLGVNKLGERKRLLKLAQKDRESMQKAVLDREMSEWSTEEVCNWLAINTFDEYKDLFADRAVTGQQLMNTDHTKLAELGVNKWGHRKRMLKLIEETRSSSPTPPQVFVSPSKAQGSHRSCTHQSTPNAHFFLIVETWGVDQVGQWLKAIGLDEYKTSFQEAQVTGALLLRLSDAQVSQLGVSSLGHRKRLRRHIAQLAPLSNHSEDSDPSP